MKQLGELVQNKGLQVFSGTQASQAMLQVENIPQEAFTSVIIHLCIQAATKNTIYGRESDISSISIYMLP